MELLVVFGAFIALAVLALRFGQDSRDGIRSQEEILALRGVRWDRMAEHSPAEPISVMPGVRARGLARSCYAAIAHGLRSLGQGLSLELHAGDAVSPTLRDYPYGASRR
jgi:hypothetical protein